MLSIFSNSYQNQKVWALLDIWSLSQVFYPTTIQSDARKYLFKVKSDFFLKILEEVWKRKQEAEEEAEAVDGRLKEAEAEAKEKLTAVASLFSH